jgi:hypothetical protein
MMAALDLVRGHDPPMTPTSRKVRTMMSSISCRGVQGPWCGRGRRGRPRTGAGGAERPVRAAHQGPPAGAAGEGGGHGEAQAAGLQLLRRQLGDEVHVRDGQQRWQETALLDACVGAEGAGPLAVIGHRLLRVRVERPVRHRARQAR